MKPFDESISEENTPPYQDLTTLLRQITPATSITAEEQSQMLARVRARLRQTDDVFSEDTLLTLENSDDVLQSSLLRRKVPRRRLSRMRYALNMIAAVLVVGVIAGASLWLFSTRQGSNLGGNIPTGAPVGPVKAPVTIRSETGGLGVSLQITSGPYFLSELLAATVTLTNHSNKGVFLQGSGTALNSCTGTFSLAPTGGSEPHYNFTVNQFPMSCPGSYTKLDAGKTLTGRGYVPLTMSGRVMLTPEARFLTVTKDRNGIEGISGGFDPLANHWPTISINVMAKAPTDRTISVQQQGSQIAIDAPTPARSHLVAYDTVTCGNTMGTSADWYPLATAILHERGCSDLNKHWVYAVGAPGYAIASGEIFF